MPSKRPAAATVTSPKKSAKMATSPKCSATNSGSSSLFKIPQAAINCIKETVQSLKNIRPTAVPSDVLNEPKAKTQSKISSHFGDSVMRPPLKTSSGSVSRTAVSKRKVESTRTTDLTENEVTSSYVDMDGPSLFETTWPEREDVSDGPQEIRQKISKFPFLQHKPRDYSRVTKRQHKRPYDYQNLMTDDESEFGDATTAQKRGKRTKQRDDKHEVSSVTFSRCVWFRMQIMELVG